PLHSRPGRPARGPPRAPGGPPGQNLPARCGVRLRGEPFMTRVRRWVGAAVVGAAGLGLTACNRDPSPSDAGATASAPVNVGAPLYPATPAPALPPPVPDVEPI